ncbi:MAG TPA: hypothetical protein VFJ58_02035 [Armatimonadota bacterium]|nr:hypothetical protein [Armatimonadota bacterium]
MSISIRANGRTGEWPGGPTTNQSALTKVNSWDSVCRHVERVV